MPNHTVLALGALVAIGIAAVIFDPSAPEKSLDRMVQSSTEKADDLLLADSSSRQVYVESLEKVRSHCAESQSTVEALTVAAHESLSRAGIHSSPLAILEACAFALPNYAQNYSYTSLVDGFVGARVRSHSDFEARGVLFAVGTKTADRWIPPTSWSNELR